MKYSLVSRDWIADCVEMMAEAYAVVSGYMAAWSGCGFCIEWVWSLFLRMQ